MQPFDDGFSKEESKRAANSLDIDFSKEKFSFENFHDGINHEREHASVSKAASTLGQVALDHLKEDPKYYEKLKKIEESTSFGELFEFFLISEAKKKKKKSRCWDGYKPVSGKKPFEKGSCEKESLEEAEYQGRKVTLNKPMRGDVKKFKVYVRDPKTGNVKKVNFGDPNMKIKKNNPKRRKSFRARHNCDNPGPKTKARYWSCKKW